MKSEMMRHRRFPAAVPLRFKSALVRKSMPKSWSSISLFTLVCLLFMLLAPLAYNVEASGPSGKIAVSGSGAVSVEFKFEGSAPKAAIIILHLGPGLKVKRASPALSAFRKDSGEARWLVKEPGNKSHRLQLQVEGSLSAAVSGYITYHDPSTGKSEKVPLKVQGR